MNNPSATSPEVSMSSLLNDLKAWVLRVWRGQTPFWQAYWLGFLFILSMYTVFGFAFELVPDSNAGINVIVSRLLIICCAVLHVCWLISLIRCYKNIARRFWPRFGAWIGILIVACQALLLGAAMFYVLTTPTDELVEEEQAALEQARVCGEMFDAKLREAGLDAHAFPYSLLRDPAIEACVDDPSSLDTLELGAPASDSVVPESGAIEGMQ